MVTAYREYRNAPPAYEQAEFKDGLPIGPTGNVPVWAGKAPPPPIGATVILNSLGEAKVTGYFVLGGYLGLLAKMDNPPDWYVKKNGGNVDAQVFGPEFKRVAA